jgi:hypothetical protein
VGGNVLHNLAHAVFILIKISYITKPTVILHFSTTAAFRLWPTVCWPQFTTPKLGAISLQLMVDQPTFFMVALANLWSELVITIIKKVMAPLEGGPEIALN